MFNLLSNFFVGFSCTFFLLIISVIIALSIKAIYLTAKDLSQSKNFSIPKEQPLPKKKRSKKPKSQSGVIHSVEIDPTKIDKIYVKKSS